MLTTIPRSAGFQPCSGPAPDLAVNARGPSWTLRCRVLALQLDALRDDPSDRAQLDDVREEALARGLPGVVREVDRLRGA